MRLGAVLVAGLVSVACAHLPTGSGERLQVRCELDGRPKRLPKEIRITLRDSGDTEVVPVHRGFFVFPRRFLDEWGSVSAECAGRRIEFSEVKWHAPSGTITFGVDTPPFQKEWMFGKKIANLVEIRFAEIQPTTGLGRYCADAIEGASDMPTLP